VLEAGRDPGSLSWPGRGFASINRSRLMRDGISSNAHQVFYLIGTRPGPETGFRAFGATV
jgi:hypothetical protein